MGRTACRASGTTGAANTYGYEPRFPAIFRFTRAELVTPLKGHLLISAQLSTDAFIVQELCESRGGRPGLSVLTSLLVSLDVKIY